MYCNARASVALLYLDQRYSAPARIAHHGKSHCFPSSYRVSIEARAITSSYPKSLLVGSISQKASSLIPAAPQNNRSRESETVRRVTTLLSEAQPHPSRSRERGPSATHRVANPMGNRRTSPSRTSQNVKMGGPPPRSCKISVTLPAPCPIFCTVIRLLTGLTDLTGLTFTGEYTALFRPQSHHDSHHIRIPP